MAFVKAKSKFDNSQCSLEKEGQRCPNIWKKDEDYIWDTDGKKAYCCKHDDINAKVSKSGGQGGFNRGSMPLHRETEDGLKACGIFEIQITQSILKTVELFKNNITPERIFDAYVAIYLGKYQAGTK